MLRKIILERRKVRSRIYLERQAQLEREVRKPELTKRDKHRMASESFRATGGE